MLRTIILSGVVLSSSVLAATVNETPSNNHLVIGLSAGPTWISGNKAQTINLEPDVVKKYTGYNKNISFPSAEIFVGWQRSGIALPLGQSLLTQLGISVVGAGNAELKGDIWEDADPAFNNFSYIYKVNHEHVAVKGRLVGDCNRVIEPYLSASVGVGFNHAYHFMIEPKISEEVAPPAFKSNTTTAFTYSLGIGFQKQFTPQFQAAIGYEFTDWGHVQFARAPGQTINQGLTLHHLYAQQLQLSLFYTA